MRVVWSAALREIFEVGFMGGKGIDMMHNGQRQHARTPEKKSSKVKLFDVLEKPAFKGKPFEYEYDFGDCWEHAITPSCFGVVHFASTSRTKISLPRAISG